MSKLIEAYSNIVGVKIPPSPQLPYNTFFPKPKKYITIHNSSGMASKNYSYYEQVINLIRPILSEHGIDIIQIGSGGDIHLQGTRPYQGNTNFYQTTYLVKNALAHIGNDSVWVHVAGEFDVPVVALYGPTYANVCGPYYHNPKTILLESHRNGKAPSHLVDEEIRTIDMILPEEVAKSILKILKIEEELNFKTIFIGQRYNDVRLHIVPDAIQYSEYKVPILVRMDLIHDEQALARILQNNKVEIRTTKPISPQIFATFSKNILSVIYDIKDEESCDVKFVELLNRGIKHIIFSNAPEEEKGKIKLKMFDYGILSEQKEFEKWRNRTYSSKLRAKSKTKIMFGGRFYISDYHFKKNIPMNGDLVSLDKEIDSKDFESSMQNLYIYEII